MHREQHHEATLMPGNNTMELETYSFEELANELDEVEERIIKPMIQQFAKDEWWPAADRRKGEPPLVWFHTTTGAWGLIFQKGDWPGDHFIEAHRIDTVGKLLEWIRCMSTKDWITGKHIRQMIEAFDKIHPGTVEYGC